MARLFIVRHGQAAFGEENYDALSLLGRDQARWLGEYFLEREISLHRIVSGELTRQKDTAREILSRIGIAERNLEIHHGLDEYDGQAIYASYTGNKNVAAHQQRDPINYWRTFRVAYEAWVMNTLQGDHESGSEFGVRIKEALDYACTGATRLDNILAVTSGGVMGTAVSMLLKTEPLSAIELNFQLRNTAFCEVIVGRRHNRLATFNSLPHLDRPDRRKAITFV